MGEQLPDILSNDNQFSAEVPEALGHAAAQGAATGEQALTDALRHQRHRPLQDDPHLLRIPNANGTTDIIMPFDFPLMAPLRDEPGEEWEPPKRP